MKVTVTTEKGENTPAPASCPPTEVSKRTRVHRARGWERPKMFYFCLLAVFFPVRITPELTAALINKNIQREERATCAHKTEIAP